jgi:L-fucose isomerase-like protein
VLRLLPLASSFLTPHQLAASLATITQRLEQHGVAHRIVEAGGETPDALLIVTGGTEHKALDVLERLAGPAVLLAHPEQNSWPAALEILGRLGQTGRQGRIFLLNDRGDGVAALARMARHLEAHRRLQTVRLGRVGAPSDWLIASVPDPRDVHAVWGPQVVDVPLDALLAAERTVDPREADRLREDFVGGARGVREPTADDLTVAARIGVALGRVIRDYGLDACTLRCFDLVTDLGTTGCLALSMLQDQGVVAGCEGDVPATLTMLWAHALCGQTGFMANPQDLDPDTHTLWLAHCTIARSLVSQYWLRSHFESSRGVGVQGDLEPGEVTLARIGGRDLREVQLANGRLLACEDHPRRCRTQVRVRVESEVRRLLRDPLGNHQILIRGHWAEPLQDYFDLFVAPPLHATS